MSFEAHQETLSKLYSEFEAITTDYDVDQKLQCIHKNLILKLQSSLATIMMESLKNAKVSTPVQVLTEDEIKNWIREKYPRYLEQKSLRRFVSNNLNDDLVEHMLNDDAFHDRICTLGQSHNNEVLNTL